MRVTISIQQRTLYLAGAAHHLSRTGINRAFTWLMDNGALLWGFDGVGEYVFQVGVNHATDNR